MNMLEYVQGLIALGLLCWFLYAIGGGWIVYTLGLMFLIFGVCGLVESSQAKQKAKNLKRIYKYISEAWK